MTIMSPAKAAHLQDLSQIGHRALEIDLAIEHVDRKKDRLRRGAANAVREGEGGASVEGGGPPSIAVPETGPPAGTLAQPSRSTPKSCSRHPNTGCGQPLERIGR